MRWQQELLWAAGDCHACNTRAVLQAAATPAQAPCPQRMAAVCCSGQAPCPQRTALLCPCWLCSQARAALQVWSEPEMVEAAAYEFADTAKYVETGEAVLRHLLK